MAFTMFFSIGLTSVNIFLLSILIVVYLRSYLEIKAQFSLGLIIFAGILIVHKLLTLYFMVIVMADHADLLGPPLMVLETLQVIAFSILTYITMK